MALKTDEVCLFLFFITQPRPHLPLLLVVMSKSHSFDNAVSLTLQQTVQECRQVYPISTETLQWVSQCPEPEQMNKLLKLISWWNEKTTCTECGEDYLRKELRYDTVGPYAIDIEETLICENCWDFFLQPTLSRPKKRTKKFPAFLNPHDIAGIQKINGIIYDRATNKRVGTVQNYSAIGHTGKVKLDEFPDGEEIGTLDPNHYVALENGDEIKNVSMYDASLTECDMNSRASAEDLESVKKAFGWDESEIAYEYKPKA